VVVGIPWGTKGTNLQVDVLGQDAAQLGYMDTCTTVDLRRKLFSHNVYSHDAQGSP
jgi:hypothetical protein